METSEAYLQRKFQEIALLNACLNTPLTELSRRSHQAEVSDCRGAEG
jgi:hypothetical protein